MYYAVRSGEGKGKLDTAVSADTPFDAAVKALQQYNPSNLGLIIEVTADEDTHYVLTTKALKASGAAIEGDDA